MKILMRVLWRKNKNLDWKIHFEDLGSILLKIHKNGN